jgi:predicted nucleic acid-binding protein
VKTFVDTNVLVYAYDRGAGHKHERASDLIQGLWESGNGAISVQVLQELYVNIRRKARRPVSAEIARSLIEDYLAWNPVINDGALLIAALGVETRYQVSFWDSMIVAAAQRAGADTLFSEDFNDGQAFGRVRVVNPFG